MGVAAGALESFDTLCICAESRQAEQKLKALLKPMTYEEAFHRDNILNELEVELDRVFEEFDADRNGTIGVGQEMDVMIKALMNRGYAFGKRIESTRESERAKSDYKVSTVKNVRASVLRSLTPRDETSHSHAKVGMSNQEFKEWFRNEVVTRRTNLRLLLSGATWLSQILEMSFRKADEDSSGQIELNELQDFLRDVAFVIGEPPPGDKEIQEIMRLGDANGDQGLDFSEFRYVVIEALARTYYSHFNCSMNSHRVKGKSPRLQTSAPRRHSAPT